MYSNKNNKLIKTKNIKNYIQKRQKKNNKLKFKEIKIFYYKDCLNKDKKAKENIRNQIKSNKRGSFIYQNKNNHFKSYLHLKIMLKLRTNYFKCDLFKKQSLYYVYYRYEAI